MIKTTGRLAAMLLVTGVVGVLLFGVLRSKQYGAPKTPTATSEFGAPPQVGGTGVVGTGSPQDLIAMSEEGVWTRIDPATGRLKYRMTWKRLDPGAPGEFLIESLRVWMIDNGRTVTVSSPRARVMWPSRDAEPESGELLGGVRLEAWSREGSDEAALAGAERIGSLGTQSMGFTETALQWSAPGRVDLEAPGVRASGNGMTMRFGQGRDRPISMFRIERQGRVEYEPASGARRTAGAGGGSPAARAEADEPAFYRASLLGDVSLSSSNGALTGGDVLLLARLEGGRLREGAIAPFSNDKHGREPRSGAGDDAAAVRSEPIVLTWSGPMEVRLLRDEPTELSGDDVFIRFSERSGLGVRAEDRITQSTLIAQRIEYGATSRRLTSYGGDGRSVDIEVADVASGQAERIEMNLTTGEGAAIGPGEAWLVGRAAGTDAGPSERGERHRGVRWSERAEFTLDNADGPIGSAGFAVVKSMRLTGLVSIFDGAAALEAESIRAMFDRVPNDRSGADSRITRLSASGSARGRDARGGIVGGEHIDVLFEADEHGQAMPKVATIRGNARAEREGESLSGGLIEAVLSKDQSGELIVATVDAREEVSGTVAGRDSGETPRGVITARADRLRADPVGRTLEMEGRPVTIDRRAADGFGVLRGNAMRAEEADGSQRLTVFGEGSARYEATPAAGETGSMTIDVSWMGGMIYDDARGRAEVEGRAEANFSRGGNERHVARGGRIEVTLTPAKEAGGKRELARALIEGADETQAEVELRRYMPAPTDTGGATLEGMAFLRGPTIEMTQGMNLLRVLGAGVLLLEDRRPDDGAGDNTARGGIELRGVRGTTLFQWEDGMMFDRAAGMGEMAGNVLIRHRDAGNGRIAEIICHRALVSMTEQAGAGMTLTRAEADGAVTGRYKDLHLSASRLVYDSTAGRIGITAEPGGSVTIHDESVGRTISGEAASVDLNSGAYRIERMDSMSLPR